MSVRGFTDFHVHLELVDPALVATGGLGRVLDLGAAGEPTAGGVEVVRAGRMLTAVGGYPSDREWAAGGIVRQVAAGEADAAVAEQVTSGAAMIKLVINVDAGPVWPDEVLDEVVGAAHAAGLKVLAHVEGAGQAARAVAAGADAFAHTPWTERLGDELIARAASEGMAWISTLRIHTGVDRERATDNLRRFHAAGGRVLYGTDMGNGPSAVGPDRDELEALLDAGLNRADLLAALTGGHLLSARIPDDADARLDELLRQPADPAEGRA